MRKISNWMEMKKFHGKKREREHQSFAFFLPLKSQWTRQKTCEYCLHFTWLVYRLWLWMIAPSHSRYDLTLVRCLRFSVFPFCALLFCCFPFHWKIILRKVESSVGIVLENFAVSPSWKINCCAGQKEENPIRISFIFSHSEQTS